MNNGAVLIILMVLLVILVLAGVYFLFFKKDAAPSRAEVPSGAPASTLVSVRNAVASGRKVTGTFEMDIDDYIGMSGGAPFTIVTDDEFYYEQTEIERFRDPSISEEERQALADSLRSRGYHVVIREEDERQGSEAHDDGLGDGVPFEESEEDVSTMTDLYALKELLMNPFVSVEKKREAEARIAELELMEPGVSKPDENEPSAEPSEDEEPGNDDEGRNGNDGDDPDGYGNGFVDPVSLVSFPDPEESEAPGEEMDGVDMKELLGFDPLADIAPEFASESALEKGDAVHEEPAGSVEKTPVENAPTEAADPAEVDSVSEEEFDSEAIDFNFRDDFEGDDTESRKAIALMSFIARNFKEGLISPELVAFAQDKLHLEVNRGYWTPEQWARANQRKGVYHRDEALEYMPLDEFDLHVKEVVASNRAAREEEAREPGKEEAAAVAGVPHEEKETDVVNNSPTAEGNEAAHAASGKVGPGKPKVGATGRMPRKAGARPVSAFFDAHGGKNDIMWARLASK